MAISKRLRFEILRRDGNTCRYCGASAPAVAIVVDHVTPIALGGSDDPANLVAACHDCNAGKSSIPPDAELVADVAQDVLRWARAIGLAQTQVLEEREQVDKLVATFDEAWCEYTAGLGEIDRPPRWDETVRTFLARGLTIGLILDAANISMVNRRLPNKRVWPYFCGVAWRRVDELEQRAREIIERDGEG